MLKVGAKNNTIQIRDQALNHLTVRVIQSLVSYLNCVLNSSCANFKHLQINIIVQYFYDLVNVHSHNDTETELA